MSNSKILDHRFSIRLDFDHTLKSNSFFQTNPKNRENLANQLLIYDQLIIPTKDFGIIPILINWLGLDLFLDALDNNAFFFLHTRSIVWYAGNSVGLSSFVIEDSPEHSFSWWQEAVFRESHIAIEQQLIHLCPFIWRDDRIKILHKLLENIKEVEYDNEFFMKNIIEETNSIDILWNTDLKNYIIQNIWSHRWPVDLTNLPNITGNQMNILNQEGVIHNPIDLVLRVAEINMELFMASLLGTTDLCTSDGAENLLKNKLKNAGYQPSAWEDFQDLLDFRDLPNVGIIIANGDISFNDLWKIRNKSSAIKFRKWMQSIDKNNASDLKKLYVDSLENKTLSDSIPVKWIRLAITSTTWLLWPVVWLGSGMIDSFFVDKLINWYKPKLFLDEISKLPPII